MKRRVLVLFTALAVAAGLGVAPALAATKPAAAKAAATPQAGVFCISLLGTPLCIASLV